MKGRRKEEEDWSRREGALGSEMEREKERGGRREGTDTCIFEA